MVARSGSLHDAYPLGRVVLVGGAEFQGPHKVRPAIVIGHERRRLRVALLTTRPLDGSRPRVPVPDALEMGLDGAQSYLYERRSSPVRPGQVIAQAGWVTLHVAHLLHCVMHLPAGWADQQAADAHCICRFLPWACPTTDIHAA